MRSRRQMRAVALVAFGIAAVARAGARRGARRSWHLDERVGGCRSGPQRRRREQRTAASRRRAAGRRHGARQHRVGRAGRHRRCHPREQRRRTAGRSASCWVFSPRSTGSASRCWARPAATASRTWAATLFAHQVGPDTWLPYLGVRLGVARTVPVHGMFEVGAWLFGRLRPRRGDCHERRHFPRETRTDYRLGGWMCGLALRVGLHLEAADPRRTEEMMAGECAVMDLVRGVRRPQPLSRISCAWPTVARIPCVRAAHFSRSIAPLRWCGGCNPGSSWKRNHHGRSWLRPTSPKEATRRSIARLRWPSRRRRRSRSSTSSS